jgi:hypothetical protein
LRSANSDFEFVCLALKAKENKLSPEAEELIQVMVED